MRRHAGSAPQNAADLGVRLGERAAHPKGDSHERCGVLEGRCVSHRPWVAAQDHDRPQKLQDKPLTLRFCIFGICYRQSVM